MENLSATGRPKPHREHWSGRGVSRHILAPFVRAGIGLLLTAVLLTAPSAQPQPGDSRLAISIAADRTRWALGDPVRLNLTVKNVSTAQVLFYAKQEGYSIDFVTLRKQDGADLPGYEKVLRRPTPPARYNFLELQPGEEWSFHLAAVVRLQEVADYNTPGAPVIRGLFLDFGDSAIHIPQSGRYTLIGRFNQNERMIMDLEVWFNLRDLWYGTITSSPVDIEVK